MTTRQFISAFFFGLLMGAVGLEICGLLMGYRAHAELSYRYRILITAPPEKVWEALITPDVVEEYSQAYSLEIDPKVGGNIAYTFKHPFFTGRITKFEPNKELAHTLAFVQASEKEPASSNVTFRMEPCNDGTWLYLEQTGFPVDSRSYASFEKLWPDVMSRLKSFLEKGRLMEELRAAKPAPTEFDPTVPPAKR